MEVTPQCGFHLVVGAQQGDVELEAGDSGGIEKDPLDNGDEAGDLGRGEPISRSRATRGDMVLSTLEQRNRASKAIAEAMPASARNARTASALAGDLRRGTRNFEALRACAGARPQVATR